MCEQMLVLSEEHLGALDVITLRALCKVVRTTTSGVKRELVSRLCGQSAVQSLGSSAGSKRRRGSVDGQAQHKSVCMLHAHTHTRACVAGA